MTAQGKRGGGRVNNTKDGWKNHRELYCFMDS